jgi:hypothetical protein
LFPHSPSHTDEYQGDLGDCYLISSLGTLADSNPAAIKNMIIDNGDGTFTVRFYAGSIGTFYNPDGSIGVGFSGGVTADYVTVDRMLPASAYGTLGYADDGASCSNASNCLWIPLIEKAYAQWNETGNEGRDGTNTYASIEGGWMATVDCQVLGSYATDYIVSSTSKQVAINALAAGEAVTIGTGQWTANTKDGLYAGHAYAVIGYNASTSRFILYNPWGCYQPGQLTWAQLQADCTQLTVADTSGTAAFGSAAAHLALLKTALPSDQLPGLSAGVSPIAPAAATAAQSEQRSLAVPGGQFSAAAASRKVFDVFGSTRELHTHRLPLAASVQGNLSTELVDATFAAEGLAPLDELSAISVG